MLWYRYLIVHFIIMAGSTPEGVSAKRAELAGNKVGWRGLVSSKKTFGIALFASLGGLVYGCTWVQDQWC